MDRAATLSLPGLRARVGWGEMNPASALDAVSMGRGEDGATSGTVGIWARSRARAGDSSPAPPALLGGMAVDLGMALVEAGAHGGKRSFRQALAKQTVERRAQFIAWPV